MRDRTNSEFVVYSTDSRVHEINTVCNQVNMDKVLLLSLFYSLPLIGALVVVWWLAQSAIDRKIPGFISEPYNLSLEELFTVSAP